MSVRRPVLVLVLSSFTDGKGTDGSLVAGTFVVVASGSPSPVASVLGITVARSVSFPRSGTHLMQQLLQLIWNGDVVFANEFLQNRIALSSAIYKRIVYEAMPQDEKLRHLFKGLSQQLLSVVAPKSPPTVHQLIAECKKYEELQSGRIFNAPFESLPEVSASSTAEEPSSRGHSDTQSNADWVSELGWRRRPPKAATGGVWADRALDLVLGPARPTVALVDGVPTFALLQDVLLPEDLLAQAVREVSLPTLSSPFLPVSGPSPAPGLSGAPASPVDPSGSTGDSGSSLDGQPGGRSPSHPMMARRPSTPPVAGRDRGHRRPVLRQSPPGGLPAWTSPHACAAH
ncbi:hypothetical protein HPB47_017190 [Ixodes persulcatus]|uniref:Uncharacterized protein n=1 Tax=Ixodes persulcatus TaxID=34615 RepID=A0AC60QNZ3_IXOPE|nr:hypothetical protein HPB47_017190 [Ixodes persulcatus]